MNAWIATNTRALRKAISLLIYHPDAYLKGVIVRRLPASRTRYASTKEKTLRPSNLFVVADLLEHWAFKKKKEKYFYCIIKFNFFWKIKIFRFFNNKKLYLTTICTIIYLFFSQKFRWLTIQRAMSNFRLTFVVIRKLPIVKITDFDIFIFIEKKKYIRQIIS